MADDAIDLKTPEAPSTFRLTSSLRPLLSKSQENIDMSDSGSISSKVDNESFSFMTLFKYFLIILILAFLGINLFGYMEVVTNYIVTTFKPIMSSIASFLGISISQTTTATVDVTSKTLKKGIDVTSDTLKKGADVLKQASLPNKLKENNENINNETLFNSLDNKLNNKNKSSFEPLPDTSNSSIQNKPKKNYCFIGENSNGSRTCAEMSESDKCMSGNIFPTLDICINPNLR
jgi:hypothetical protein